jgi:hypothetical protein
MLRSQFSAQKIGVFLKKNNVTIQNFQNANTKMQFFALFGKNIFKIILKANVMIQILQTLAVF